MTTKTKKTKKCSICTDGTCFYCRIEATTKDPMPIELAIAEANRLGHMVRSAVAFSNEKDWYLVTVEVKTSSDTYCVWTYNATDNGFHNGEYVRTKEELRKVFLRRVSEH